MIFATTTRTRDVYHQNCETYCGTGCDAPGTLTVWQDACEALAKVGAALEELKKLLIYIGDNTRTFLESKNVVTVPDRLTGRTTGFELVNRGSNPRLGVFTRCHKTRQVKLWLKCATG